MRWCWWGGWGPSCSKHVRMCLLLEASASEHVLGLCLVPIDAIDRIGPVGGSTGC